jgi:hypothetical protein
LESAKNASLACIEARNTALAELGSARTAWLNSSPEDADVTYERLSLSSSSVQDAQSALIKQLRLVDVCVYAIQLVQE